MDRSDFFWEFKVFGPEPRWLWSPDLVVIETLSRRHLQLSADRPLDVKFFASGAFNKLYLVSIASYDEHPSAQYIFRVTSPVEPFYKTASEVATLSYLREFTSIPAPRVFAYSSTAANELGCEWILMDRIPGVALKEVWDFKADSEAKANIIKFVADVYRQLRASGDFNAIGNLYFREDIEKFDSGIRSFPTRDEKYVIGPIVTTFMFGGGRKLHTSRNLGPYTDDAEYIAALTSAERSEMELLLSADPEPDPDLDKEDIEEILMVLDALQPIFNILFPSRSRHFILWHQDFSLNNILVDPTTFEVTGIVDWECVGTRPQWEHRYPYFLQGQDVTEVEQPTEEEANSDTLEFWQEWEMTLLRPVFDREIAEAGSLEDDERDEIRREFRRKLDGVEVWKRFVLQWMNEEHIQHLLIKS